MLLFLARWDISLALSSKVFRKLFQKKQLKDDMDAYAFVNKGGAKKLRPEVQDESAFPADIFANSRLCFTSPNRGSMAE